MLGDGGGIKDTLRKGFVGGVKGWTQVKRGTVRETECL